MAEEEVWRPGSFTKNFSWGKDDAGLVELHTVIRAGFGDQLEDVPRKLFRERVAHIGRPDLVPINFFLFNRQINGEDYILADELVFQAMSWDHNPSFDKVALFAFLFSYAGKWKGANKDQRRAAMWANAYVVSRVAKELNWSADLISADDIQKFVDENPKYHADTSRKLATNLYYLLRIGRVQEFGVKTATRWWVDCLFLALDRLIEDARLDDQQEKRPALEPLLKESTFSDLTGGANLEKDLATKHLVRLYSMLGGRSRLFDEAVVQKTREELPQATLVPPNNPSPRGAIHPTNPKILKSIPALCAELAKRAGFEIISPGEMEELQLEEFARQRTTAALVALKERGIVPTMTIEELLSITRGK